MNVINYATAAEGPYTGGKATGVQICAIYLIRHMGSQKAFSCAVYCDTKMLKKDSGRIVLLN
jgi:hypothetical protein